jgi:hypothetical protein
MISGSDIGEFGKSRITSDLHKSVMGTMFKWIWVRRFGWMEHCPCIMISCLLYVYM